MKYKVRKEQVQDAFIVYIQDTYKALLEEKFDDDIMDDMFLEELNNIVLNSGKITEIITEQLNSQLECVTEELGNISSIYLQEIYAYGNEFHWEMYINFTDNKDMNTLFNGSFEKELDNY